MSIDIPRNWNSSQISENNNKKNSKHIKKQFTNFKKYLGQRYLN